MSPARRAVRTLASHRQRLRFGEWAKALRNGTVDAYRSGPHVCGYCRRLDPLGLEITTYHGIRCSLCAPRSRQCRRCRKMKPLGEFDVAGGAVQPFCIPCRKMRASEYYQAKKKDPGKPVAATRVCTKCEQELPASEFYLDGRYRTALMGECRQCHN